LRIASLSGFSLKFKCFSSWKAASLLALWATAARRISVAFRMVPSKILYHVASVVFSSTVNRSARWLAASSLLTRGATCRTASITWDTAMAKPHSSGYFCQTAQAPMDALETIPLKTAS
jgi:hypothetical protein